jgi:hypothetical protein
MKALVLDCPNESGNEVGELDEAVLLRSDLSLRKLVPVTNGMELSWLTYALTQRIHLVIPAGAKRRAGIQG